MTLITKLMIDGYATPAAIYKMQDATNNLFNSLMAEKPESCDRTILKSLTDTFVVQNYIIKKNNKIHSKQKAVDYSIEVLLKNLENLGIKDVDIMDLKIASYRARRADIM